MASQNKITEIIFAIKTLYSYYAKDTDVPSLVKIWGMTLNDYPDDIVDVALVKCLQTCTVPPTPADVIKQIKTLMQSVEPSDEELWNVLTKALREADRLIYYFQFNAVQANGRTQGDNARTEFNKLWEDLPEKIKQYLGGISEFINMSGYSDEDLKYEKNRFLKNMPIIQARQEGKVAFTMLENKAGIAFGRLEGGKQ